MGILCCLNIRFISKFQKNYLGIKSIEEKHEAYCRHFPTDNVVFLPSHSGRAPLFQGPPCLWQGDSLHVRALLCWALQTKGLASQKQEPNQSKLCWPGLCRD